MNRSLRPRFFWNGNINGVVVLTGERWDYRFYGVTVGQSGFGFIRRRKFQ